MIARTGWTLARKSEIRGEECRQMHLRHSEIARAYDHCEAITKCSSKSFYLATTFLSHAKRRALRAFYAFCRTTDDIVDLPGRAEMSLDEWRRCERKPVGSQSHPVLLAWSDTRARFGIPHQFGEELMAGCEMDLTVKRYETFTELRRYCYHVASTVGLVSMHIIGSVDGKPFDQPTINAAINLGVALQLTNILRDVGEDLLRGRIYLPQEEMAAFGYGDCDVWAMRNDTRFQALMKLQIVRIQHLYDKNLPWIAKLQPDGRLAVGAAILLYRGILDKIVENNFDVFHQRAHLSGAEKLLRLPRIYRKVRRLSV